MAIKSILAPLTGYEKDESALVCGLSLARRFGAFVDVLHVKPDPRDAIPLVAEGAAGPVIAHIIELAEQDANTRAAQAQRLFDAACKAANVVVGGANAGAGFRTLVGRAPDEVSVRARVRDLVVMGRVPEDNEIDWRLTLEATLMEGGRPILLLPAKPADRIGKAVAIAWNGSAEAAHAASAALPFLAQAERVLLLAGVKETPVEPSLGELGEWLSHHGIKAEQRQVALTGWPVGEQLVDEAAAAGADLIVMGGYGHSRMRETIFGGATRAVLNEAKLPALLSH
jgi:nucleotide-binding universal stress UspA family protein